MEEKRKLEFELIPAGCWKVNLHELLPKKAWDKIKTKVKARANGRCEVCGKKTDRLDAHEVWSYDEDNGVQKLENVIAVCKSCHNVFHINRSYLLGLGERAEDHYMKVNGVSYAEMKSDLKKANEVLERRSRVPEWKLDVSYIKVFDGQ